MQIRIDRCPFCGYSEFIQARQRSTDAYVFGEAFLGLELHLVICRHCGSVVRSFVEEPEKLLKRKNRRTKE